MTPEALVENPVSTRSSTDSGTEPEVLRKSMPLARELGDKSTYSECSYSAEGPMVRIKCQRFSERKKYTSPISLLVGPTAAGDWLILEELSESQP